jgi:hypothetical protein
MPLPRGVINISSGIYAPVHRVLYVGEELWV